MQRITQMLFVAILFASCDDRYSSLKDFNDKPNITLQAEKGLQITKFLKDSVKLSKQEFAYMPFIINIEDPNSNIRDVVYQPLQGAGQLIYRGEQISGVIPVIGNKGIYKFIPQGTGLVTIRFIVTDRFNQSDSATMQLTVFNNLPPTANLYTVPVQGGKTYEYQFDASGSFDTDHSFGGIITKYIFFIGNERIETVQPTIPYIFSGPGTYTVRLQVMDNDGATSREVTQLIQFN